MNVIPPRGQIPDIPPWSWISLIDTRWSHALSLNTLKTIHFIFLFDPHIYPHTPHSHLHTPQVSRPFQSSILTSPSTNPQSVFCLRQRDGSAAPAILCFRLTNPLVCPRGHESMGRGLFGFWRRAILKFFYFQGTVS